MHRAGDWVAKVELLPDEDGVVWTPHMQVHRVECVWHKGCCDWYRQPCHHLSSDVLEEAVREAVALAERLGVPCSC